MRIDKRKENQIRPTKITCNYLKYAEGSVLIEVGDTKVICSATVDENIPPFKKDSGEGWVTAEYAMLPRATGTRNARDISKLRLNGRASEIQRLIGRSLRSVVNLSVLGERRVIIDCDVIQADGGTRTASITGAFVAMVHAFEKLVKDGAIEKIPVSDFVSAISVGVFEGKDILDLCYEEDSKAEADMNVVMSGEGKFIEIQVAGEKNPFTKQHLESLLELAEEGIGEMIKLQKDALGTTSKMIGA